MIAASSAALCILKAVALVCIRDANGQAHCVSRSTDRQRMSGIHSIAQIGERKGGEAKRDAVSAGRHFDAAEQCECPQDRCWPSVDLRKPAGIVGIVQHQQAAARRCCDDLNTTGA